MKKIVFISLIISLAGLFSCESRNEIYMIDNSKDNDIELRSDAISYDYVVKPGTEAWNVLETEQERIDALQIPEEISKSLSPDEVVRLSIELPAFLLFTAFNTPQDGFSIMLERYNILKSLVSRKDVGASLIAAYKDAGMGGFKTLPYSNEFWSIRLYYIELLLSQNAILLSLSPEEKLELLIAAMEKFTDKVSNEAFATLPGVIFTVRIMACILDIEKYPEFSVLSDKHATTILLQSGWWLNETPPINEIVKAADNYINSKSK
jgi:hypothetical protein